MKSLKHFKFLFQCYTGKPYFDIHNLFYNIIMFIIFVVFIINKNNMFQAMAYFSPDILPFSSGIMVSVIYIFVCLFLISKIIGSFNLKKMIFYKELGFTKSDIFILKTGAVLGNSFICSLLLAYFVIVDFDISKMKYFCIYTAIFFISFTVIPVILSYIYNPLKPHHNLKFKERLFLTKIFFKNKYTSYLYKDIYHVIRNPDFIIGFALIIFIMIFSSIYGKGMNIIAFSIILYLSSAVISVTAIDFYIIEIKDYLLMKILGINKKDILQYKTVNICIISWSLLSLYYIINIIIGNISFASTFLIFLFIIIHSFVSIVSNNLVSIRYFPNESKMKYYSFKFSIISFIPFISLLTFVILYNQYKVKNKQISEL